LQLSDYKNQLTIRPIMIQPAPIRKKLCTCCRSSCAPNLSSCSRQPSNYVARASSRKVKVWLIKRRGQRANPSLQKLASALSSARRGMKFLTLTLSFQASSLALRPRVTTFPSALALWDRLMSLPLQKITWPHLPMLPVIFRSIKNSCQFKVSSSEIQKFASHCKTTCNVVTSLLLTATYSSKMAHVRRILSCPAVRVTCRPTGRWCKAQVNI